MLTLKLVPDPDDSDMILIVGASSDPVGRVELTTLYGGDGHPDSIWGRLCKGETVVVELRRVTTPNH